MNLEYGEGKSCTESSIISVKSLPYTANYLKLVVSIGDFIVKKIEFCQSHVLSHIRMFTGSVDHQV